MATGRIPTTANSPLTTKGDLFGYSTTQARVAVGSDGDTLVADSAAATGLRYNPTIEAGKNRIINGAMLIDQRNTASTAVTVNAASIFRTLDLWRAFGVTSDGVYTVQQVVDAPDGFYNSLKATVTTADASLAATDAYFITQNIEGYNVNDFALGTAAAKTFTLSFWVKSSLTGTFGGSFRNSNADRSFPFTYAISSANTWEYKTVTLTGDTSGTWQKTNLIGIGVNFSLGAGTDRAGTASAWNGNNNSGATGQTQIISTLNATLFITGVQLERGSVATAFSNAGGTIQGELAACQRYYVALAFADGNMIGSGMARAATNSYMAPIAFPVTMRTTPSVSASGATDFKVLNASAGAFRVSSAVTPVVSGKSGVGVNEFTWTSGDLVQGNAAMVFSNSNSCELRASAEL